MAGTPKPIGRVLLMPKGDYNATAIYYLLDLVRYDGKTWVCKVDGTTGVTPVEGTEWSYISENGKDGTDGTDGTDGQDGTDGRGISSIAKTGVDPLNPLVDIYTITYTDGTTTTFNVTNGQNGGGSGGDMYEIDYVKAGGRGIVLKAKELYDDTNNKTADTEVLANLNDVGGTLYYGTSPVGGAVSIDGSTIVKNDSSQLEVPIDKTTVVIDSTSKKMKVADEITQKLPNTVPTSANEGQVPIVQNDGSVAWGNVSGVPEGNEDWLKSKNLIDESTYIKATISSGKIVTTGVDSRIFVVKVEPNETYTILKNVTCSTALIGEIDTYPQIGDTLDNRVAITSDNVSQYTPTKQYMCVVFMSITAYTYSQAELGNITNPTYTPYNKSNAELTNEISNIPISLKLKTLGKVTNVNLTSTDFVECGMTYMTASKTAMGAPPKDSMIVTYWWTTTNYAKQVAYSLDDEKIYVRRLINGVWDSSWKTITPV